MAASKHTKLVTNARELRRKLGMNQQEFWTPLRVTQSGGSRYEAGRSIPGPAQIVLDLIYGDEKKALALLTQLREQAAANRKAPKVASNPKAASGSGDTEQGEQQEGDRYPCYKVVAGSFNGDEINVKYISPNFYDLSAAIDNFKTVSDYAWSEIEYHISASMKYTFIPVHEEKTVL